MVITILLGEEDRFRVRQNAGKQEARECFYLCHARADLWLR